jgi:hypothetical protein
MTDPDPLSGPRALSFKAANDGPFASQSSNVAEPHSQQAQRAADLRSQMA